MTGRPIGARGWRLALFLPLLLCQTLWAQIPEPQELTDQAIMAALDLYNRPGTVRMSGDSRIAAGSEIVGDLSVLEGVLIIEGAVRGDVLVLNGDLELGPSARIEGSATVIGGSFKAAEGAAVTRGIALYRGSFPYRVENDVLVRVARAEGSRVAELAAGRDFEFGRTDVIVTAGRGYNRVEGLPIYFGPRLTLGHSNPTVLEGLLTYRTSTGLDVDDDQLGYSVRVEQYLGGWRAVRVGARAFSEITPIELGGLSDRENSLAAFVLHRDYRDHYERDGWAAYVSVAPLNRAWSAGVEYAEQREGSLRARRPWSLLDNSKTWRPQPLAATGAVRSITVRGAYDSRNRDNDPSNGWWLSAALERALGGSLRTVTDSATTPAPRRFTDAT
ncbi:MAG TPA: polymer-forming cytoskeletal protein, partial [Longimicrobiales bacterium]|nr:polymer-forming cytoskeletal protein [Longimicrobiales bacterium]